VKTTNYSIRLDPEIKIKAEKTFSEYSLNLSEAINLVFRFVFRFVFCYFTYQYFTYQYSTYQYFTCQYFTYRYFTYSWKIDNFVLYWQKRFFFITSYVEVVVSNWRYTERASIVVCRRVLKDACVGEVVCGIYCALLAISCGFGFGDIWISQDRFAC